MATIPQQAYGDFLAAVKTNRVKQVTISPKRIEYTVSNENSEETYFTIPDLLAESLPDLLQANGVEYTVQSPPSDSWLGTLLAVVLPPLVAVGAGALLLKYTEGSGGVMGVGKSKARTYAQGKTGVKFADVAGVDEAKQELQEVVDFLKNSDKYTRLGAKIPKGVLLVGPPGTGKTLLAKAVAGEAGVPFFSMSGSEFVELYVGVGASRVRDLFDKAKRQAPCIIFIDELDAIGKSRGNGMNPSGGNDEREQTLNQLLTEMDGFDGNNGVILIAATNRPEVLDPALRRPGRFDRQVVVDRPDRSGRVEILTVHANNVKLGEDVDLELLATRTSGLTGADLANLVNEAALMAARNNRQAILMADFDLAFERVLVGLEKRSRVLNPIERQTVAYHEVGHALVGALMPGRGKVEKISIVPRGVGALGYTLQMPDEDRFLMMEDEIRGQIATLLGGRAAELLVFGKVSTGASDDIQKATILAEKAITLYGMSDTLGPIAFANSQSQFSDGDTNTRRAVSGDVAIEIDRLIKETIDRAYNMAVAILKHNRELLESTTQILLDREILDGDSLKAILSQVKSPEG
ncbi:ATP-dependent zinc metalloprotease FtsH [Chamaesiphon minutus]|uniref:ATP-dependent zinc metalloprotease FtsH n=1 Tax=Chamaesiphon minutus (strain ATCC 27169 / PCC 6605) TaxID=1173020 RepID=K9UAV8_CHAP6|nr:ATP-dependent zinc metalloprotease FtsH [Chamaesiphon minutus]AFY91334.1 ATP-dependent metalloprotease FtsH [Chamaesiphon minutus PCC 6605]